MERLVVEAQGSHNQNDEIMKIIERRKSTKKVKKVKTKKKKKKEKIKKKGGRGAREYLHHTSDRNGW